MATAKPPAETPDDRILVELYCERPDCPETEELLSAVASSARWSDRVEIRVKHRGEGDIPEPFSHRVRAGKPTVIVCGTHLLHGADYGSLTRALEDCEEFGPA
jgi:hypothetical protein